MLKRILNIAAIIIIVNTLCVFAENQPAIEHITSNNGLSHNTIRCILQDKTGFIWFGSLNGLNRYDGINIKTFIPETNQLYSLSSGKIKELKLDSYGHIWVRTYNDIMHCYDPYTEKFLPVSDNTITPENRHNLIYEDNEKNIWLGSNETGCIKISFVNGTINKTVFSKTEKENNLQSNYVNDIYQDSRKTIWILTKKGISLVIDNKVIRITDKICTGRNYIKAYEANNKIFLIDENANIEIYDLKTNKIIRSLRVDGGLQVFKTSFFNNSEIYISTNNKGVYIFDIHSFIIRKWDEKFEGTITGNAYFQIDQTGNLWLYNMSGKVWMIRKGSNKLSVLDLIPSSILQLIDEERYQFQTDKNGNIWITTYGNGLFCYNLTTGNLTHYSSNNNNTGISSAYLLSIILDKNDNIWVGTENMGVNKLSFVNRNVDIHFPDPGNMVRNGNVVRVLFEDNKHNIWVATKAGNLYIYDPTLKSNQTVFKNSYNVYSIIQDSNGSIWLATRGNGVIELKYGNYKNAVYYQHSDIHESLSNNNVFSITKDNKNRLWAATFGGGVNVKYNQEGAGYFRTFFDNDEWIRFTRYILTDKKGDIWVATTNGILHFNPDVLLRNPNAYKYYTFNPKQKNCLSNPEVRYIFEDSKGQMWFATAGGGVNLFCGETKNGNGIFKTFKNPQGISNDNIMSIREDENGFLWLSTESGLHTFNPKTGIFQYYKFSGDFSSNLFSETASIRCSDGRMIFGSLNGFYAFYPKMLKLSKKADDKVVLTGFSIYDQYAEISDKHAPLIQSVSYAKKIILKASDKVFHIEFSNLNFTDPRSNQFMYILENYEKRWNPSSSYNIATYRNVPPGNYIFKVKSPNSQGAWDDNYTSIEIIIRPPFWRSLPAYFLYFILLGALLFITYRLINKFNTLNNAVRVERQLTDYKLRFFTNISHEFRTPLTLIKGGVDTLIELKTKMSEPLQQVVDDLNKNTTHLLRLIEQLLEFRKLQNNKQKLNLQRVNAVDFLKEIYQSFTNVAEKMNIEYKFLPSRANIPVYFDKNKIDKIVFNLLSNAFKFTLRGGKISLIAEADDVAEVLRISVTDNGIGIPREKQNLLFSRFMQINFSESGTGIGLSLVSEFTNLHKGKVNFNENEGGGSVFTVEFSLNSNIYSKEDFVNEQVVVTGENKNHVYNISEFIQPLENESLLNLVPNVPMAGKNYKILVIDDNDDIRDFLKDRLSSFFEIITASNGNEGFAKSMEDDPDLIICDVMMPGLNGFDLTKKLKDDFATCHIPVILLTAYVPEELNIESIKAGADAYISKPFSMKHLILQINKLIEKRELLHKHYAVNETTHEENIEEHNLDLPEKDSCFLKEMEEILEKHLTNPEFSVDEFAQMMNTGRTLFFKKIKYLTGYTPNEFVRVRRMKKAAELLKTYKYNVSEVSYMVGINDPFYFSKCFKAQYGCSPSRYLNT